MPPFRRALCALAALWAASATAAVAHAYVDGAQPPANSENQSLNGRVGISFDEPIDIIDSNALEVFAPDGRRIDRHDVKVDPADATRIIAHVPTSLERGVYTVRWRVISADTHVVHGAYRIGLGVPVSGASASEAASPYDPASPLAAFLRWLSLMGALLAAGAVSLCAYQLDGFRPKLPGAIEVARRCAVAGAATTLAAWVPAVVVQAAAASGVVGGGITETLLHTTWGAALLVRAGAGLAILLAACSSWGSAARRLLAPAAILLATFSVTGHAFAQPDWLGRTLAIAIDFAHLGAAAIWIGGLFVLAAISIFVFDASDRTCAQARTLFAAFTPTAALCVGVIIGTGLYASSNHVTSSSAFLTTFYGRLLLAKTGVLAVLLAFGWHHSRVAMGVRSYRGSSTLLVEAAWGIVVVALTALLVGQVPPASAPVLPASAGKALLALICVGVVAEFAFFSNSGDTPTSNQRIARVYVDAPLGLCLVLFLGVGIVGRIVEISSVSMYPTLQLGDVVFVDRMTYKIRAPRDGELVVFRPPVQRGDLDVVQRVIGVGGDSIEIADGVLYRNGVALREPYVAEPTAYDLKIKDYAIYVDGAPLDPSFANVPPRVMWQSPNRIPRGFYLILGDNRNYSIDSHSWGFAQTGGTFAAGFLRARGVSRPGKPLFIAWPLRRAGLVETT